MKSAADITIPDAELSFTYARASGPGGQHVNKVNSKAVMSWNVKASDAIGDGVRQRFLTKYATRISDDGSITIQCDEYRDRPRNIQGCIDRLKALLAAVWTPPKPRKKTKPSKAAREKRLSLKKQQSERKANRKKIAF